MSKKLNIAVIFGGVSGEHEVSLASAANVIKYLNKQKYNIVQVGITKGGEWVVGADALKFLKTGKGSAYKQIALSPDRVKNKLSNEKIDVVFPVLHGPFGEDGTLQGLLELSNLSYVGCGVLASSVAMDKIMQKQLCGAENILVPDWIWFSKKEWQWIKKQEDVFKQWSKGVEDRLGYPLFVKPSNMGSSVGISKVKDKEELISAINTAAMYDNRILVEAAVHQAMDIEVAILGNSQIEVSEPGYVIPSNEFYDYQAKYVDGKSQEKTEAPLPDAVKREIKHIAERAFKLIDGAGMARIDFLVNQDGKEWNIFLSEINTIPGFTKISMYPKLWQARGLSYKKLLDKLISLALERYNEKQSLKSSIQTTAWYK